MHCFHACAFVELYDVSADSTEISTDLNRVLLRIPPLQETLSQLKLDIEQRKRDVENKNQIKSNASSSLREVQSSIRREEQRSLSIFTEFFCLLQGLISLIDTILNKISVFWLNLPDHYRYLRSLHELESNSNDPLAGWGSVHKEIRNLSQNPSPNTPPVIGPIGGLISVSDDRWKEIVEMSLSSVLESYVVESIEDDKRIRSWLLNRNRSSSRSVAISASLFTTTLFAFLSYRLWLYLLYVSHL